MPESSGSMYSSILMLENIWYYHFTWSGSNSQEIVNLFPFDSGPWGPTIGTKFIISYEFSPFQVKWWRHLFCKMTYEEYMAFELLGIFQVQVAAKNILLGSLETHRQTVFAMWCLFLKKKTHFLNQTVTLKCFLCKNSTLVWFM